MFVCGYYGLKYLKERRERKRLSRNERNGQVAVCTILTSLTNGSRKVMVTHSKVVDQDCWTISSEGKDILLLKYTIISQQKDGEIIALFCEDTTNWQDKILALNDFFREKEIKVKYIQFYYKKASVQLFP